MSEALRRRSYVAARILIESSRVLNPQFSDAVLHITGAQLELLRNVVHYLDRVETFVDEYNDGYYIVPDSTDWDSVTQVVANLEEKLMGNENVIFGYYAQLLEDISGDMDMAGDFTAYSGTPPAGQVWVIQVVSVLDRLNNPTLVRVMLEDAENYYVIKQAASPGTGTPVVYSGSFVVINLQRVRVDVLGSTAEDPVSALVLGYKMQVPV